MAAPLSPHSRFMSWVNELRAKRPSYYDDADSEAEEEEVLELLLPNRISPSSSPSPEPQSQPQPQPRFSPSEATSSGVRLPPTTASNRMPLRGTAVKKGKEKTNEEDVHEDKRDATKLHEKRKRSEESNDETDAGGSASKKQPLRKIKRRSTSKGGPGFPPVASFPGTRSESQSETSHRTTPEQPFSSPSSSSSSLSLPPPHSKPDASLASAPAIPISIPPTAATEAIQDFPLINVPPADMEEYEIDMGEDDFHSSDSEPGGYLANGRRRRRELERARTRDALQPANPLPASTVWEYSDSSRERSESHFRRPREKRWMSREFYEHGGLVPSEGGPSQPPKFIKRSAVFPKRNAYVDPRYLSGPSSKPVSDVSVICDPLPAVE